MPSLMDEIDAFLATPEPRSDNGSLVDKIDAFLTTPEPQQDPFAGMTRKKFNPRGDERGPKTTNYVNDLMARESEAAKNERIYALADTAVNQIDRGGDPLDFVAQNTRPEERQEVLEAIKQQTSEQRPNRRKGFARHVAEAGLRGLKTMGQNMEDIGGNPELSNDQYAFRNDIRATQEEADPSSRGTIERWIMGAAEMTPTMTTGVAVSAVATPVAGGVFWYSQIYPGTKREMEALGLKGEPAELAAQISSAAEAAIELVVVNPLGKGKSPAKAAAKKAVRQTVKSMVLGFTKRFGMEWSEEMGQSATREIIKGVATRMDDEIPDTNLRESAKRVFNDTLSAGGPLIVLMGVPAAARGARHLATGGVISRKQFEKVTGVKGTTKQQRQEFATLLEQREASLSQQQLDSFTTGLKQGEPSQQVLESKKPLQAPAEPGSSSGVTETGQEGQFAAFEAGLEQQPIKYVDELDQWFGERDLATAEAQKDTKLIQDRLKESTGATGVVESIKQNVGKSKKVDQAQAADQVIQLNIDLRGQETEEIGKFYNQLNPEQKVMVEKSQNLPPEQLAIADDIIAMNERSGQNAVDAELLANINENYTMRLWESEGKQVRKTTGRKFGTQTDRAKKRTLSSILEGWAKGKKLRIKGASNAMLVARIQVAHAIADRKLIDTGIEKGTLSTQQKEGYVEVQHPNFTKWKFVAKIDTLVEDVEGGIAVGTIVRAADRNNIGKVVGVQGDMATVNFKNTAEATEVTVDLPTASLTPIQPRGKNVLITPDGVVMERAPLYVEPKLAKNLNNAMGTSKLKGVPGFDFASKWNAIIKANVLTTSLFHHQAFLRSFMGASHGINPIEGFKAGREAIETFSPMYQELVAAGMTTGKIQDWDETLLHDKTMIGELIDKVPMARDVKDSLIAFRDQQTKFLFSELGPYLKTQAAILEFSHSLNKHKGDLEEGRKTRHELAGIAARAANADFGGLHLGRIGRDPTLQHVFRLMTLAPDWTESNIRMMAKAIVGGSKAERQVFQRMWGRVLWRFGLATIIANLLLASLDDKTFWDRYQRAWKEGPHKLRWLDIDLTPIYRALGGKSSARKYFSLIGHFRDAAKFIVQPIGKTVKHKGSILSSFVADFLSGTDWAGRPFTSIGELLAAGRTVGKRPMPGGGTGLSEFSSFGINKFRGSMPIQVQNFVGWLQNEIELFDALTKSAGFMTSTTYPKPIKRRRTK